MAQIVGKYAHTKSENLDNYFKAGGIPYIPRKMMCSSNPTVEISSTEAGEWTITTTTMFRTATYTFKLGEEYEEQMPGVVLKCITQLQDGKLITTTTAPDGSVTTRVYEFSDEGMILTYKRLNPEIQAVRHYKRVQ